MTKFGKPEIERIVALYESGHSPKVIAKALDIPLYRIKAIVSASKFDQGNLKRIAEMRRTGMTSSDIARALGLSKQYVNRIVGTPRSLHAQEKEEFKVIMNPGEWKKCMDIAEEFGLIVDRGIHSGRGSVRKMLEYIARGNLHISKGVLPE